ARRRSSEQWENRVTEEMWLQCLNPERFCLLDSAAFLFWPINSGAGRAGRMYTKSNDRFTAQMLEVKKTELRWSRRLRFAKEGRRISVGVQSWRLWPSTWHRA